MAKKKKQIHLNIIDFQKYYQKDDLIIQPTPAVENTIEEKKKKIFDKNEYVQNIEWRTTESTDKKINNKVNDDNNKFKKSDSTITLGSRGKNKLNEMKDEDVDFANLRSKKKEDDVDFANLRNKKKEDDADFGNLRNKKKEDDADFSNLRNKKKEDDVDFANLRNKKKDDDADFANLRNKKKEDDADFANLRNKKKEEDVDFGVLRNKKKEEDADFANLRNKKKDDDADFGNLRNKKKEDDVDFGNLRNKKKDDDADFANLRNKKKEEDVDFANLRNKKKEDDADFANLRNKKKEEDVDFANLRNKKKEDDADFANLRNKKKEEDVDFGVLRNKKKEEDVDFANLRSKKKEEDVDFSNLRSKKTDTETKTEKPYHLRKLEELRKQKQLKRQETEASQNEKLEEKTKTDKKEEEVKADKKEEEIKADKKEEEVQEDKKEEVKEDEAKEDEAKEDEVKEDEVKADDVKPAGVAEKNEIDGNNETKVEEGAKKKFVPKRVIMYQEELKKKEEELKKKEEERKKKLEEQKKQRELSKLKSQASDGSNVFIPSAKLLHLESLKEEKKETKIEIKRDSKSVITPPISKKDTTILSKQKSAEKNVKNIFLEIAEKTENAKIVEKMDIEEIAKKKREELYKKQLEKITKINEENTKYNNIYKHDINNIKSFYNQIKDKILQNHLFTEDDSANICASLKTDECNYLESHVPFYVTISVFILSLPQKLEDDMYIKRASQLKNLLFYLKQNSKIENQDDYILNDIIKLCDELKYPHLSEETTLLEAVFDCLLFCGIISKDAFIKWFADDNLDSELKSRAMLQLIYWNNWLKDEVNDVEYVEDEPEEPIEEKVVEEDDIEKNVPKNFIFRKIKKKFL
ncbi:conserved Plasmodium protein, unknown function [Plasmodium chabaudi chabaudi]|uniref:W2 domain-containing protein n=1 Tax=Plasmodium chabaudi chabaudi TaxID=31271 RepID=A0A1C6YF81_PLACU|nr:conserved Plasmodium protein, unknown function [Plasmodium chabaudi chabaudi]SCN60334.1 conserved Plasmodium protein, unknown function [Plasmodium chabaudi chabaudi]